MIYRASTRDERAFPGSRGVHAPSTRAIFLARPRAWASEAGIVPSLIHPRKWAAR